MEEIGFDYRTLKIEKLTKTLSNYLLTNNRTIFYLKYVNCNVEYSIVFYFDPNLKDSKIY